MEIKLYPDPVLKQVAAEVTAFDADLKRLLDSMHKTMVDGHGVGLAGNQVGVLKRVVVIDTSEKQDKPMFLVNPKILSRDGSIDSEEGCLSIPDYRDTIQRSREVRVQAFDESGKSFEFVAEGLLSRAVQHEIDHLDGILFVDRLSRLKREMFKRWHKKRQQA